jgi:uncharacterized membrane protein
MELNPNLSHHISREKNINSNYETLQHGLVRVVYLEFPLLRNLGLGGSIVLILGIILASVPTLSPPGTILMIIGAILILIALYGLSQIYGDRSIFRNALGSFIAAIIAWILFIVFFIAFILSLLGVAVGAQEATGLLGASAIVLIVMIIALAVSAFLWYRALRTLSARSGEGMFRWAATTYAISVIIFIIGIILTVALVGILLILIAGIIDLISYIFLALGFYNLKPPATQAQTLTT